MYTVYHSSAKSMEPASPFQDVPPPAKSMEPASQFQDVPPPAKSMEPASQSPTPIEIHRMCDSHQQKSMEPASQCIQCTTLQQSLWNRLANVYSVPLFSKVYGTG